MIILPHRRKAWQTAGYAAYASKFDGIDDYLNRGGDLTGNIDGKKLTLSMWLNLALNDTQMIIYINQSGYVDMRKTTGNNLSVTMLDSAGSIKVAFSTSAVFLTESGWIHFVISFDTAIPGSCQCYVNGVSNYIPSIFSGTTDIDFTRGEHTIFSSGGYVKYVGNASEIYMAYANYDLSSASNLALFRTSAGKPTDISANIAAGTLATPIIYFKNPYTSFGVNSGTGGNFTANGTLENATPP